MGNKLGRKRHMVDDKYTKPQGLYQNNDVNQKKLRKLILGSKLAPCYSGYDDSSAVHDLEECPICFLHYPSLNRSTCCMKGICTECFLQMQPPHSSRPTQCPFCKTSNYAVEYKGMKSKEERGKEQLEEQRVIEAKIRMQQKEYQEQEKNLQKRQEVHPSNMLTVPGEIEYRDPSNNSCSVIADEQLDQQVSLADIETPMNHRNYEFDTDLEEIMIMEAITLSMQEHNNSHRDSVTKGSASSAPSPSEDSTVHMMTQGEMPSTGGLAYGDPTTVGVNQLVSHGPLNSDDVSSSFSLTTSPHLFCFPTANENSVGDITQMNWIEALRAIDRKQHVDDDGSGMTEAGASYSSSGVVPGSIPTEASPLHVGSIPTEASPSHVGASIIPSEYFSRQSFEEQMMLAIALSLADSHPSQVNREQIGSSNK